MTSMWLIAKTDPAKEFQVAQAISQLGHTVWVPTYVATAYERFTAGPGITLRRKKPIERPLIPQLVLTPNVAWKYLLSHVPNVQKVWSDKWGQPLLVPDSQIAAFRERVEAVNAAEIARIKRAQLGKRKGKRTVKLDPTLAEELKSMLFGERAQEAA